MESGSPIDTTTTSGAREHARSQAGTLATSMRHVPAGSAHDLPADIDPARVVWDETLGPGRYTTKALAPGVRVRFTDIDGDACLQLLAFNAFAPHERLNVADTVKIQWQAYLGEGSLLLTDMGRVLATIVSDTSRRHDTFCGVRTEGSVADAIPSARALLTLGVARFGLDRRDVHPTVNLFKSVRVGVDGSLTFEGGAGAGAATELRFELPVFLVVTNTPHVLDVCTPARIVAWTGEPGAPDDPWRVATPEAVRAFENTDDFLAGHPMAAAARPA
jgi:urea carboxylase-associated protein 2